MKKFKTDWLASKPVFYNEKTLEISHNINDVIDWSDIEFHPEGLNNFLDFGYSVFGQTPLKNVKFLRFSSEIYKKDNKLVIKEYPDPVLEWLDKNNSSIAEEDVLSLIKNAINNWEESFDGNIIIPTSGGYDSRLLNYLVNDKVRVRSFSYGVSFNQSLSEEALRAKKLSKILGTTWKRIELGDFHNYFDEWDQYFGISTHAHGMYQIEFYNKLKKYVHKGDRVLSGIIGDAWAGSIPLHKIINSKDIIQLGYTHDMSADSKFSKLRDDRKLKKKFLSENKERINDPRFQIVVSMRLKILLLSYLMEIPEKMGWNPWSPFLDMEVALSMLSIGQERRKGRKWQKDFFKEVGLDLENIDSGGTQLNYLNHLAIEKVPLKSLDLDLLSKVIESKYIRSINRNILEPAIPVKWIGNIYKSNKDSLGKSLIIGALKRMGLRDPMMKSYCAYLTLKPIENILYSRNKYK
jgi:asparagine synthetase B (glutamine-hydrolysing)